MVGRHHGSADAKNSLSASPAARAAVNVTPDALRTWRWTRLLTGSQMKALARESGPSSSSR
jgi:hypothetical protein